MIIRIFHVKVREGKDQEFEEFCRTIAFPLVKRHDGLRSVVAGKPLAGEPGMFCITMVWESIEALVKFAGDDWKAARIEPEEEHLVEAINVEHYDLFVASGGVEA